MTLSHDNSTIDIVLVIIIIIMLTATDYSLLTAFCL